MDLAVFRPPVAIYGLELYGTSWSHEFVSLSTGPLVADDGRVHWAPSKGGVAFRDVTDAPVPAADEAGRLRQMRDLARRFEARVLGRAELRAAAAPPPDRSLRRPDLRAARRVDLRVCQRHESRVILLLEARRQGDGPARWWFAAARLSRAELHLKLGPREVWTAPIIDEDLILNPEDTYYTTLTPRRSLGR